MGESIKKIIFRLTYFFIYLMDLFIMKIDDFHKKILFSNPIHLQCVQHGQSIAIFSFSTVFCFLFRFRFG